MAAKIISKSGSKIVVEVEIDLGSEGMLDKEMAIRTAVNQAGALATEEALKSFDADGEAIVIENRKFTSKGRQNEFYECPYGRIAIERHVYQNPAGGKTFCPLENDARMILNSTPGYAKILSGKYARNAGKGAAEDLFESSGRVACPVYIKKIGDFIGAVAEAEHEQWEYELPQFEDEIESVAIGLDGTCMLLCESGWREAMTGTISLYNRKGERVYTIYTGAFPEYGKATFLARFDAEIERIKAAYPDCVYIGTADGAPDNWKFLNSRTDRQVLDFYHASEYVKLAASTILARRKSAADEWSENALHKLKHKHGAAKRLLNDMRWELENVPVRKREPLLRAITYFANHYRKMNYARQTRENRPIGSGVTEAACKELIKQRLCNSGMRWKKAGASAVIAVRSLIMSEGRWEQFWDKISKSGCPEHKKYSSI